jgi:hypothetical protein
MKEVKIKVEEDEVEEEEGLIRIKGEIKEEINKIILILKKIRLILSLSKRVVDIKDKTNQIMRPEKFSRSLIII